MLGPVLAGAALVEVVPVEGVLAGVVGVAAAVVWAAVEVDALEEDPPEEDPPEELPHAPRPRQAREMTSEATGVAARPLISKRGIALLSGSSAWRADYPASVPSRCVAAILSTGSRTVRMPRSRPIRPQSRAFEDHRGCAGRRGPLGAGARNLFPIHIRRAAPTRRPAAPAPTVPLLGGGALPRGCAGVAGAGAGTRSGFRARSRARPFAHVRAGVAGRCRFRRRGRRGRRARRRLGRGRTRRRAGRSTGSRGRAGDAGHRASRCQRARDDYCPDHRCPAHGEPPVVGEGLLTPTILRPAPKRAATSA